MNVNVAFFLLLFRGLTLGQDTSDFIRTGVSSVTHSCCSAVYELLKEFGAMKEKQRSMETRLMDSETRLQDTETRWKDTEKRLKENKARLQDTEDRLKDNENQILELKNQLATKVIFSARTSARGAIGPYNTQTTLVYGSVITNVGNAYNQHTGIFTAPVPGTYYFTFFYHAGGHQWVNLHLMRNNEVIVNSSDHETPHDGADNGGNAAFVQLQKGDHVYVRLLTNKHVWGADHSTTFSGFLISPE